MKKTWKQWIAIACVLSMIACMLPAMTLAEDGVATPTDLTPVPEEPAGEEPTKEPGEETIPGSGIPELLFGIPGYKGTLKAGEDFTIVLHSDRYANILVTLVLSPKNGQPADTEGVKVLFNEKDKKLVRVEKEDADSGSIDLQFEAYIAPDTDYIFVITSPFDADFTLTAVHWKEAAAEQEDGDEEEPAEEEPAEEEPAEETKDEEPVDEEPENVEKTNEEETNPEEPNDITITEIIEEENTVHAWISTEDDQTGETITLKANAEPELDGVPTWYVRNEEVEEGAWKKAGYGSHLTIEAAEGNEYRFVLQDGTVSETFRLIIAAEEIPEDLHEETEDAEEVEQNPDEDNTDPEGESEDALTEESETPAELEETANVEEPDENEDAEEKSEGAENADVTNEEENKDSEEETQEEEREEEPEEEAEILPDPEELLALGYYGTQVVMSKGADVYESTEEGAEPVEHLEAGTELWVIPTETEGWAEIYRTDEETPVRYIRWDDVIINQKPETEDEEEEEELPARSVEVTSSLWGMLSIPIGTEITMKAELINFKDDDICTFQWQYRPEGADAFIDIGDANELTYVYYIDEENFYYTWRLIVIVAQGE